MLTKLFIKIGLSDGKCRKFANTLIIIRGVNGRGQEQNEERKTVIVSMYKKALKENNRPLPGIHTVGRAVKRLRWGRRIQLLQTVLLNNMRASQCKFCRSWTK